MRQKIIFLAVFSVLLFSFHTYINQVFAKSKVDKIPNKKILVVFYSRTGNTKRVALDIAGKLMADSEEIIDKKSRSGILGWITAGKDASQKKMTEIGKLTKDPGGYDLVVIGTPVWAWSMTPAVRTYITQNKDKFKQTAYFITSGNTAASNIVPSIEELSNKKGIAYTGFTQKELKDQAIYEKKLDEFIQAIMKK